MKMKYPDMSSYWDEIENYGTRGERFFEEFQHVDSKTKQRMIEWLDAVWHCAREVSDEE